MSCQAGRHTGLAVCLAGVTSASISSSMPPCAASTTTTTSTASLSGSSSPSSSSSSAAAARSLSWRQVLRQGQFTLLRSHRPHNHYLRVLQTAASVVAISSYSYLASSEPRVNLHPQHPDAARHSSSFPHLSSLRSTISSFPAVMAVANQTRSASSGDDHEHSKTGGDSHSHSHSHSPLHHHHHHDNAYLTSTNKSDPGVRITRIGLMSNLGMAIAKFAGGWAFNSKAMTADAWHSITDLASDILTLATVSWSLKPPTDRFPMGFGKIESLGSLGVSGMLLAGGMYMGWESGISLYSHFYPEAAHDIMEHVGHGHSHSHLPSSLGIPSMHAAWLAAGTIMVKEWLYHATMKVARERKSSVLASNAIHHRVDSLTGFVTLAAIIGANVMENAAWLDPVGGLLISFMVIHAGWGNTMAAFYELADQSIDDEIKASVRRHAQKALASLENHHDMELRDVSGVKSGQNYLIDLEVSVPGSWTVENAKEVEDAVRTRVGAKVRGARRIRIRFAPKEAPVNAKFDDFVPGTVTRAPESEEEEDSDGHVHQSNGHDHDHDHDDHKHKH